MFIMCNHIAAGSWDVYSDFSMRQITKTCKQPHAQQTHYCYFSNNRFKLNIYFITTAYSESNTFSYKKIKIYSAVKWYHLYVKSQINQTKQLTLYGHASYSCTWV